jgi:hypothetical protein
MPPPKNDPDYEERMSILKNIINKWDPRTHINRAIPEYMRYDKHMSTWPLPILRAINDFANEMPGDDGWIRFFDLLEEGHKRRMNDKSNNLTKQLQPVDLAYVREYANLTEPAEPRGGKGKQKMVDKGIQVSGMSMLYTLF